MHLENENPEIQGQSPKPRYNAAKEGDEISWSDPWTEMM